MSSKGERCERRLPRRLAVHAGVDEVEEDDVPHAEHVAGRPQLPLTQRPQGTAGQVATGHHLACLPAGGAAHRHLRASGHRVDDEGATTEGLVVGVGHDHQEASSLPRRRGRGNAKGMILPAITGGHGAPLPPPS
jgi:hypothetical protein